MLTSHLYSYQGLDGRYYVGLLAKRRYVIRHQKRIELASDQKTIQRQLVCKSTPGNAGPRLIHDTELIAGLKPATDVLLSGSAHSQRGALPVLTTALRVGPVAKITQVTGERQILLKGGRDLSFTSPEPFTTMELTWDRAYGGRDIYVESKMAAEPRGALHRPRDVEPEAELGMLSYPRNAFGRGFFLDIDRERIAGTLAPNLEDPADPVRPERMIISDYLDWIDCPVAACFEPIDLFTFPRALFFVPAEFNKPSRPVHEVTNGALTAADLELADVSTGTPHSKSFNCAPAGLSTHRLYGAERVQLWNLHRERELLEFDLPGERPRLLVEPPGVQTRELSALLQTVLIEPELDRVTLTWAGALEVASPYAQESTERMRHAVTWNR